MTVLHASANAAASAASRRTKAPLAWNPMALLMSRLTFGATPAMRRSPAASDPDSWWNQQLTLGRAYPGYTGDARVRALGPLLGDSAAQTQSALASTGNPNAYDALHQLSSVTLGLQLYSQAPMYEALVDFFANHLNVYIWSADVASCRHTFDRDVVRANVFGKFSDMLLASSKSPAMLRYLNQSVSTKAALNYNYARELLELHTVGLVYREVDVNNAAVILSGRTVDTASWTYTFDPAMHQTGPVKALGFASTNASAAAGGAMGDAFIAYLASHPQTARHLARKLCTRFVSDTPSATLVAQVARVYLQSGTAILPTVYAILCSEEFWQSRGAKTRRPRENLVAAARALGVTSDANTAAALSDLRWHCYLADDDPLGYQPPSGFPDTADRWRSAGQLAEIWTVHRTIAHGNWVGSKSFDPLSLFGATLPATSGDAIDALCLALFDQLPTAAHRAVLQQYLNESATTPFASSRAKSCIRGLVSLLFDSPYHAMR